MANLRKTILTICPLFWAVAIHAFTSQPPARTVGAVGGRVTNCFAKKDANMSDEEKQAAMEKALSAVTRFSNKYTENTGTYYCEDKSIPAVVIKGLAEHKVTLGTPLCPCRFYEDKEKEAKEGYWNCPCVPMRERHECHCMLFLTEENDFAGDDNEISFDEVKELSGGLSN